MKRVVLGALDYGVSFGVDRTLRELLLGGRLSAVGCLSASPLWSREFKPMQEVAQDVGDRAMVGLTIAFSGDRVAPLSDRFQTTYGMTMPPATKWARRATFHLLPDELLQREAEAQLDRYSRLMEKTPDFVAVRDGLLAHSPIARLVVAAIESRGYSKPPVLISPQPSRGVEDKLRKLGRDAGLSVIPKGPPIPELADHVSLQIRLKSHFNGLRDMVFINSIPGRADDRLRREEPKERIAVRECQREVLASDEFFQTLVEREIYLN